MCVWNPHFQQCGSGDFCVVGRMAGGGSCYNYQSTMGCLVSTIKVKLWLDCLSTRKSPLYSF